MALSKLPGAFASLSSGLLARKGAAKPAMRPQGFGQMGASLEDLGWNDMGFEAPQPVVAAQARDADHDAFGDAVAEAPLRSPVAGLTPSPVHGQQAEIAQRFAAADGEGAMTEQVEDVAAEAEDVVAQVEEIAPQVHVAPPAPSPVLRVAQPLPVTTPPAPAPEPAPVAEAAPEPEPTPVVVTALPMELASTPAPQAHAGATPGPKAAFTLRLDQARHLRLRLACALTGRSAQMLVTQAVDRLIAEYPELDSFAGTLPQGGRSRRTKGSDA